MTTFLLYYGDEENRQTTQLKWEKQKVEGKLMIKKTYAIFLILIMLIIQVACSNPTVEKGMSKPKYKVGVSLDVGGVKDGAFNQTVWEGALRAKENLGIDAVYLETENSADYQMNIETLVDEDCDLVVCVGYSQADDLREAALRYPNKHFVIIDDSSCEDIQNVLNLIFKHEQAAYMVGYVAGKTTKTNKVGLEIGMSIATMHKFGYGYIAGVLDANPNATVLQANANSFADSAIGKTDANMMITKGADVIFHAAGPTGLGVIDACAEAGISAIGVDVDQHALAEGTVITSAVKNLDEAIYNVIDEAMNNGFEGGVYEAEISNNGVGIAATTKYIDPQVLKEVNEIREKIAAGQIVVPSNQQEFEARYNDVYLLD